jgi:two-component system LytT family sensor kinase
MKRPSREFVLWSLALFALYTAIGILLTASEYFNDLARQQYGTLPLRVTEEMVGAYSALALLPLIVWFARRYPMCRRRWPVTLPLTVLAALVYSLLHTTINAVGRDIVWRATLHGRYDYGIMLFRYPMEAAKDLIFFFLMIGGVAIVDTLARERRVQVEAAELQTKLAEAKLENLRLQLHPHFLFNTLNAISSVMYEDVRKADRMLAQLSEFLRVVLESSGVHEVTLDEELRVERMYVEIMKSRLERSLALDVTVDEALRDSRVPFMVLQPLLENSIRHGMNSATQSLHLSIDVARTNGSTVIRVTDDGCGIRPDARRGIGLSNVESRLEHLYGASASFSIGAGNAGGTVATLTLPAISEGPA